MDTTVLWASGRLLPKVKMGTGKILLPESACAMNDLNRETLAVNAAFKAGNGFDTTGAFANLPADNGCEMVTSNKVDPCEIQAP